MFKTCNKCSISQEMSGFRTKKSGWISVVCRACERAYAAEYRVKNRAKHLAAVKSWGKRNQDKVKAGIVKWRKSNSDKVSSYNKAWRSKPEAAERNRFMHQQWHERFPWKRAAKASKYRAAKIQRTPSFLTKADFDKMEKIYSKCPQGFEVDHIIPLQGKNVSGLHVPVNLQYLPISENRSKRNKFEVA